MDNMNEEEYETVLRYMQEHNHADFQTAYKALQEEENQEIEEEEELEAAEPEEGPQLQEFNKIKGYLLTRMESRKNILSNEDNSFIKRMGNRVLKSRVCSCISKSCNKLVEYLLPEIIKRKVIRSKFYQIYQDEAVIELKWKSIEEVRQKLRKKTPNFNRPHQENDEQFGIVVIISDNRKNHCLTEFLKQKKLLHAIENNFFLLGVTENEFQSSFQHSIKKIKAKKTPKQRKDSEVKDKNSDREMIDEKMDQFSFQEAEEIVQCRDNFQNLNEVKAPSVLILRERQYQQLVILHSYYDERMILDQINIEEVKKWVETARDDIDKERAMFQKVTSSLMSHAISSVHKTSEAYQHMFSRIRHIVPDQVPYSDDEEQTPPERYIENKRQSTLIKKQNEMYTQMQKERELEELKKKEKEREWEVLAQERQVRKMSIPDEPEGENQCTMIFFRCPNGDTVTRRFLRDERCQILFHWVELNDQIEFEELENGEPNLLNRNFDLLYSYPPQSLIGKEQFTLDDVFQGSEQVKLMIKQL